MDQFTQDPEAHATGRYGGGAGTGASPWEVGEGPMAATDRTTRTARPIAGGSAPETQDEIEDLYQQSLQDLQEGEVVKGTIIGLTSSEVLVDVGYKSEGTIPIDEFHRSGITPEIGQEIEVYLEAKEDSEGLIVLSKEKADKIKVWDVITRAYEKGAPVDGKVVEVVKGGLAVDVGVKAFLPGSQVDLRPVKNLNSMIGQHIKARVIKFNRRRGNVVLSRRVVLEEEREEKRKHTLAVIHEGMVTTGVVKNITDYGAFIDLGGVDGLLHITDMSWGRISHPSELVQVGDKLDVVVLHFDKESGRVSLGHKQKGPDPWESVAERFSVGSRHPGKVVSLTNYGAFVELDRGIEGLVHVSEMSWTRRVRHPSKLVNVGDDVEVMVLAVDKGQKRISLGMKQVEADPWDSIEERFRPGREGAGEGAQPDGLRRVRGARAGDRRPPAHLRHDVGAERGASLRAPQEGAADRDGHPPRRQGEQADLAGSQAAPARPVGGRHPQVPGRVEHQGQGGPPHGVRRLHRARGGGGRSAPHLADVEPPGGDAAGRGAARGRADGEGHPHRAQRAAHRAVAPRPRGRHAGRGGGGAPGPPRARQARPRPVRQRR